MTALAFDPLRDGMAAVKAAAEQLSRAEEQVATGRRVSASSDDPLGTLLAIGEHAAIGTIDAYSRAGDSATSRLYALDAALANVIDNLTQALAVTISARGTTADQTVRDTVAQTLAGNRDALLADVNASFQGTHLFSGSRTDQPAFAVAGGVWTYQGDTASVRVHTDQQRSVAVSIDGQSLFQGTEPVDLFSAFDALIAAVRAGDAAGMGTGVTALERAVDRATRAQSLVGNDERVLDESASMRQTLRSQADVRRSKIEDVDMGEAITRMNMAQTAYRGALAAVSAANQVSLLDYLK